LNPWLLECCLPSITELHPHPKLLIKFFKCFNPSAKKGRGMGDGELLEYLQESLNL
jgi:hypothetical protein